MRRTFFMLSLLLFTLTSMGQNVRENYYDGEFFLAEEDYSEALYAFNQVYKSGYQDNANLNYRMGICLLQIQGRKTEAIPYLEKAIGSISERYKEGSIKEENAPPDALLYLGNAYRINGELVKAKEKYRAYEQYLGPRSALQKAYTQKQIESCDNAARAMQNPVEYKVGNLGQVIETHADRYNVVVSFDQSTMAFMGKNPFYNSVQVSRKQEDGTWSRPLNITPSIVSDGNMDVVSLSPDGKTMLLAVSDEFDSNIYTSDWANNRWNPAITLGKPINSRYFESHATFSPDTKSIYFTSNREESMGGMDIFRSDLQPDGSWSEPVNLGPNINTTLNEDSPFLSPDGKKLYFSSQGHETIGGFDMFYSEMQPDGSWGKPVNLGYPLNTTDDDLGFTPLGVTREGASVMFANGMVDSYDLFKFEFIDSEQTPQVVAIDEEEQAATQAMEEEGKEEPMKEPVVEPETPEPARYFIRPVYFEFDKYDLSREAMNKLDRLSELLKQYPEVKIQITGHTDAVGSYEYNQRLSENRANSVSKYLILNGITKDRIATRGMSESEPVARNRTRDNRDAPKGRELNRRVQFNVSVSDKVVIQMEKIQVPDNLKLD